MVPNLSADGFTDPRPAVLLSDLGFPCAVCRRVTLIKKPSLVVKKQPTVLQC